MLTQLSKAGKPATETDINICFFICVFFAFFIFFAFFLQFLFLAYNAIIYYCYTIVIMLLALIFLAILMPKKAENLSNQDIKAKTN